MKLGAAWLVIEESFHGADSRLLSVISARKNGEYVRNFIEQTYVDHYASFSEKIAYKNNREHSPFKSEGYERTATLISCGHDPIYRAFYCHKLWRSGEVLHYAYRFFRNGKKERVEAEYEGEVPIA